MHSHGRRRRSSMAAPFLCSGFSSGLTNPAYSFLCSRRTSPSSCFAGFAPAARRHRRRRRGCGLRAWPGHCRPPRAVLEPCTGSHGHTHAAPPLHHRRRAPYDRHRRATAPPLLQIPSRTSRDNSTIVKGLSAMSLTQVNSAHKDLFAGV